MAKKSVIVVDGANVAYIEESKEGEPKVSNLVAVRKDLEARGYEPVIIVDASLRHQVDDPDQLEALMDDQKIHQAPAGTDADYFILQFAEQKDALVVSNDEFEQYQDQFPWIEQRRVPLMIVHGDVQLYGSDLEEHESAGR
jgi:hypothetical protein